MITWWYGSFTLYEFWRLLSIITTDWQSIVKLYAWLVQVEIKTMTSLWFRERAHLLRSYKRNSDEIHAIVLMMTSIDRWTYTGPTPETLKCNIWLALTDMVRKGRLVSVLKHHISDKSSYSYLNVTVQRYCFDEYLLRLRVHVFRI